MRGAHGLAYVLLLMAALGCVCSQGRTGEDTSSTSPRNVLASTLVREFENDAAGAAQRYRGSIIEVFDSMRGRDNNYFEVGNDNRRVRCYFAERDRHYFSQTPYGVIAVVRGRYQEFRREGQMTYVVLSDCRFVSDHRPTTPIRQPGSGRFPGSR
jgi:hypothetical protein